MCYGGSSTITVSANGGTAPYSGTGTFSVYAGTYTYTVTDANGCSKATSITVGQPSVLMATSTATGPIVCNGGTTTVSVSATGGTPPYSGVGTFTVTAGAYSFTVADANGCTKTTTGTLTQPAALTATITNDNPVLYFGYSLDQSAIINVKPSGGTPPYKVSYTMNRPINCNLINSTGDEIWTPGANTSTNQYTTCPSSGSSLGNPVSTSNTSITSATGYSLNVTLMQNAVISATVTDAKGCTYTITTSIHAEDVRCFAGNSNIVKVKICHKTGSTKNPCVSICVDNSAVAEHLSHGDFLGTCTSNCLPPPMVRTAPLVKSYAELNVRVLSNPTYNFFKLKFESDKIKESITMKVVDINGRIIEVKQGIISDQIAEIGSTYYAGVYFAEVVQGTQRKVVKLIKIGKN